MGSGLLRDRRGLPRTPHLLTIRSVNGSTLPHCWTPSKTGFRRARYASTEDTTAADPPTAILDDMQGDTRGNTTGGRKGRPGYDLGRLLDVSVQVFIERGYEGTSMEDLAHRLGITKSAIY